MKAVTPVDVPPTPPNEILRGTDVKVPPTLSVIALTVGACGDSGDTDPPSPSDPGIAPPALPDTAVDPNESRTDDLGSGSTDGPGDGRDEGPTGGADGGASGGGGADAGAIGPAGGDDGSTPESADTVSGGPVVGVRPAPMTGW